MRMFTGQVGTDGSISHLRVNDPPDSWSKRLNDDVQRIAELARTHGLHVAAAESLTSGAVCSRLGAGPNAAEWFRGGVVAYGEVVKFDLLGVTPGPVVTERCAQEMAQGVARLLDAEIAIGITGVGGPGPEEGNPPGTVIMAVAGKGAVTCRRFRFPGSPDDVLSATANQATAMLSEFIGSLFPDSLLSGPERHS